MTERAGLGEHVHVRLRRDVAVSDQGELTEEYGCRCGATWTRRYGTAERE